MRIAKTVQHNKTGEIGHVFYLDADLIPSRKYMARFKGTGGGYSARECKGSELTIIEKHK